MRSLVVNCRFVPPASMMQFFRSSEAAGIQNDLTAKSWAAYCVLSIYSMSQVEQIYEALHAALHQTFLQAARMIRKDSTRNGSDTCDKYEESVRWW